MAKWEQQIVFFNDINKFLQAGWRFVNPMQELRPGTYVLLERKIKSGW